MGFGSILRKRTIVAATMLEGQGVHDAVVRISRPIDTFLTLFHKRVERAAPIFIMGPQRSGTTLFYKCFQQHQQVCWLDQATDYFPECFISASLYFRSIGATDRVDFLDRYDLKKDLWIRTWKNHGYTYTEGNRIWNKLGPRGSWLSNEHRSWAMRSYPRMVDRLQRFTDKAIFLNKCPANALRIGQLLELFPDARFIHVERDPRGVINSIHNIHRALGVKSWGPMPVPASELEGLTEYEGLARQWVAITDAIQQGLQAVPDERKYVVRYEDFIGAPDTTLAAIASAFGLEPFRAPLSTEIRAERMDGWRKEIPAEEIMRIERIIHDAGHAASMGPV